MDNRTREVVRVCMKMINIAEDFSKFPGPRFIDLGPYSGQKFKDEVLKPAINDHGDNIVINLDGTMGYGSSFLEESFGGLIRDGIYPRIVFSIIDKIISTDDISLIDEVRGYVTDEVNNA